MLPKTIHYCWFGGNPLPESAKKNIESWKRFCPGFKIKEWNESNFNIRCCDYVRFAYSNKKWAFVSDYARFWILYHYGGIYFDTDVEMIRSIEDIIADGPFMGIECTSDSMNTSVSVAPGLGLGVNSGNKMYEIILQKYESFKESNVADAFGVKTTENVVSITTDIFKKYGFIEENKYQKIEGISIYPSDYFCPMDYKTGKITISDHTRTIHYYDATWLSKLDKKIARIENSINRNSRVSQAAGALILTPIKLLNYIQKVGFLKTVPLLYKKIKSAPQTRQKNERL